MASGGWGSAGLGWAIVGLIMLVTIAPAAAQEPARSPEMMQLSVEPLQERVVDAVGRAKERIIDAYGRSPVLMIGLAVAGALPLMAALFAVSRFLRRRDGDRDDEVGGAAEEPPIARKAWIANGESAVVPFAGELIRIGRHSDNDITLDHDSVHRHHALIQRSEDDDFVLIDLTAGHGNRPLLNGTPVGRSRLANGDSITLGDTTLTFHLGAEVPVMGPAATEPSRPPASVRESTHDDRDTADGPTGRAGDRIQTRRIGPVGRIAARSADRGRA